jgi:hypothetical protein
MVHYVNKSGTRFLKQQLDNDTRFEINHTMARDKVSHSFRNCRKLKQLKKTREFVAGELVAGDIIATLSTTDGSAKGKQTL